MEKVKKNTLLERFSQKLGKIQKKIRKNSFKKIEN